MAAATGPPPLVDPHLVAWWRFDDGAGLVATDATGHGNVGSLVDGPTWAPGKQGGALSFDGIDDYLRVAVTGSIRTPTAMTAALWVWIDATQASQPRLMGQSGVWYIKLNGQSPQLTVGSKYAIGRVELPPNAWHHLAVVFDHGIVSVYFDGLAIATDPNLFVANDTLPVTGLEGVYIAASSPTSSRFHGLLDDVRLYDRALSAAEVAELAQ